MPARFLFVSLIAAAAASWGALAQPGGVPQSQPQPTDALDGTWEVVSVIEGGKPTPLDVVKQTVLQDGRIIIKGQLLAFPRPDSKVRTLAFVTDPKASPKTIDLAGTVNVGGKGIYMRDGDTLLLCLPGSDTNARPTQFASLPGSDTVLLTLRRVNLAAAAPPAALPPPAPRSDPPAVPAEDAVRKMLIGTWGHQTDDQVVKLTFNPDGTFSSVTTFKKGLKRLFDEEDRKSGTWRLKDGEVILSVTAAHNRGDVGQVHSYRITSITDSEVLYVDNMTGGRRIEWKLR